MSWAERGAAARTRVEIPAPKGHGPELMSVLADCYGDLTDCDPKSVLGRHIEYAKKLGETKYVALISTEM